MRWGALATAATLAVLAGIGDARAEGEPRKIPCSDCARYYVSHDGDDRGSGSKNRPWRTLQKAADSVVAGDIVVVGPGRYRGFDLRASGKPDRLIWFTAVSGAIIDTDNPTTPDGINLEGASHVGIDGFKVESATRAGIRAVNCADVTIAHNRVDNNGTWGIFTGFCDDLVIEDNEATRSHEEHGIYVSNSADRPVIRRNRISGNTLAGIHINADVNMGGDGLITQAVIEGNIIYDVGEKGASAINCDGMQASVIRNNLIYEAHASGISLYRIDGADGAKNNLVVNNTVVMAADGRYALNIQAGSTGNIVRNNILLSRHPVNGSIDISDDSRKGFRSDHNVVMDRFTLDGWTTVISLTEWQKATGQDGHTFVATAEELYEPTTYQLLRESPAIDRGTSDDAPRSDLRLHQRPVGKAVDIGAFEHCVDAQCVPVYPDEPAEILRMAPPLPPRPPRKARGCGGCAGASTSGSVSALAMLIAIAWVASRRRSV